MRIASIVINLAIFLATGLLLIRGVKESGPKIFRYFTVLSNAFCALSALVMALCQLTGRVPEAARLFKYLGTVSVTVTLATVLFFLGPTQGYRELFSGYDLYMHLIGPLMAITSFLFLEKGNMPLSKAPLGVIPVALYGVVYLYKVIFAPQESRWKDFYGFNRGGKWPLAFAAMLAGTLAVCALLCLP